VIAQKMPTTKVVDYAPEQEGKIFFGAFVTLEDDDGKTLSFQIVGYDEIFQRKDAISIDSPMARACLKKEVDDEVLVTVEGQTKIWYVNTISYHKTT
jgi:transcription elongation factor GreB